MGSGKVACHAHVRGTASSPPRARCRLRRPRGQNLKLHDAKAGQKSYAKMRRLAAFRDTPVAIRIHGSRPTRAATRTAAGGGRYRDVRQLASLLLTLLRIAWPKQACNRGRAIICILLTSMLAVRQGGCQSSRQLRRGVRPPRDSISNPAAGPAPSSGGFASHGRVRR